MLKTLRLLTFLLIPVHLNAQPQAQTIDSLINQINNNQIYSTCQYILVIKIDSDAANLLIQMGKPVTDQLIPLLDNPKKGIITHYILSNIWLDTLSSWSMIGELTLNPQRGFNKLGYMEHTYCGLLFYEKIDKERVIFTFKKYLRENKKWWMEKFKR